MNNNNLTANEMEALKAIFECEYHDGCAPEQRINNAVYVWACNPFRSQRSFSGTMASLSKKGLANTDGECCWITRAGFEALREAGVIPQN